MAGDRQPSRSSFLLSVRESASPQGPPFIDLSVYPFDAYTGSYPSSGMLKNLRTARAGIVPSEETLCQKVK
jgi:hypothetical protein